MSKKIIFLISLTALFLVAVFVITGNASKISDVLFMPNKPLYFLKEWTRSSESFLAFEPEKRIRLRLVFTIEKLNEIRRIKNDSSALEVALANYLSETENLKLSAESLRGINNIELGKKLVDESFYQRQLLASMFEVKTNDSQNYILTTSFNNLISSAFYVAPENDVFESTRKHISSIESAQTKIEELDYILTYSPTATFKERILFLELEIIENKIANGFSDISESNYFKNKLSSIQDSDYYKKRVIALEKQKKENLIKELSKGIWIDEIIKQVPGEEIEILESFKMRLAKIKLEKLDQKIDDLQVYEETKVLLREARDEIIASIYGEVNPTQVLSVIEEESVSNKDDITKISPASAFCLRQGYELGLREKDGVAYVVCIYDGLECEQLAFYRGECEFVEEISE
ncbi:MAG: hypothetical protein PHR47_03250 [Candidatus Pacebacteria bacterium]|nr:hypothetical protein [Candidatus Paceibacterota bacterium]